MPSFSKRHASFNSPREIPLPADPSSPSPFDDSTTEMPTPWLDRCSSASLPVPSQIPFYALPRLGDSVEESASSSSSSSSSDDASLATSFNDDVSPDKPTTAPPDTDNDPSPPSPTPEYAAMCRFMSLPTTPHPDSSSYPLPEPPVILPLDPPDHSPRHSTQPLPPYVPFLSDAPPPPDSWIQVETTATEYRLHVRLPGFSREGITLATKRRRILHVVADKWGEGGGHFERRISFGYDADLVHVRAEFDGVMLNIIIPRRQSPVIWNAPAPFGRI